MLSILITGAARGIGHELVQRALARGDLVFATVRKPADAERFPATQNLKVILMDVADSASVEQGFAEIDRLLQGRQLDAVINAAAISLPGALELAPISEFEQTLNTNAVGSARIARAAIPRLRGHGGRLIFVTSLWGRAAGGLLASYCASKHAIEAIADVARRETAGMNLHVVVCQPGVVMTKMLTGQAADIEALLAKMTPAQKDVYGVYYQRYAKLTSSATGSAITTAKAAENIERALFAKRPRTRYQFGIDSKLVCFLAWLLPDRWMDAMMNASLNRKPL